MVWIPFVVAICRAMCAVQPMVHFFGQPFGVKRLWDAAASCLRSNPPALNHGRILYFFHFIFHISPHFLLSTVGCWHEGINTGLCPSSTIL